jgi:hypothetical protein
MKRSLILISLIFTGVFFNLPGFAQRNDLPGYIINLNGDTIKGLIDYQNWESGPDFIKFKTDERSTELKYGPDLIREFGVNQEVYISAEVNTEVSPNITNQLTNNPLLQLKKEKIFLLTVFKGNKSLYYYFKGKDNFYIAQSDSFELLIWKRYIKDSKAQSGTGVIAENKKYVGQLSVYLGDCPTIHSKLNSTNYNVISLTRLFKDYYECSQTPPSYQKKPDKIAIEIGAVAGVSFYSAKISSSVYSYLDKADYSKSTNPAAGTFLNIVFPRFRGKIALYDEILYTSFKITGEFNDVKSANDHTYYKSSIGYSFFTLNTMLRYSILLKNNFGLYLGAGIVNSFVINETNIMDVDKTFYVDHHITSKTAIENTRGYEQGIIGGLGVKYGKLSLECRYELGNGTASSSGVDIPSKRWFFLLGYTFPTR